MEGEIVNRVANSKLKTIDLEEHFPQGERLSLDLSQWLFQGLILKEKDFRASVAAHDWAQYQGKYVAIRFDNEAIVPSWAYLLISLSLAPYAKKTVVGDLELLEQLIFEEVVADLPLEAYQDLPVIIKGCSDKSIPDSAYAKLVQRLQPIARSIMFGEACSSVPLYKKK